MSTRTLASGKSASKWVLFEKRFVIPDYDNPKEPSRIRWRLFHCPYFGIYLHKWFKPDPRPTLHNHPWSFFSVILQGGYSEVVALPNNITNGQLVKYFNWMPRVKFHTVVMVVPGTISIMFVGRDHGKWGYMTPEGYVPFEDHPHTEEFKKAMAASKQLTDAECADCGKDYEGDDWVEAVIDNDVWDKISPTGDSHGLLCIACMQRRCVALDISASVQILTYRGLNTP